MSSGIKNISNDETLLGYFYWDALYSAMLVGAMIT